ncbi:hypothetical protein [Natronolimnohabitans innermongolicus]|uniref:Uncharacterized protein n=1 Tax=Natronolimnohabitans innermongolicus JCM 12255 TaxID=1227499 RepID=L9XJV0_9EURY|nr:hypothetical protein [Natronolimnohabitans innermongolicus]ELY62034.1 hypothetical protein C493_01165 [Natronolimnohabitans innermongolicus JCM 12255]
MTGPDSSDSDASGGASGAAGSSATDTLTNRSAVALERVRTEPGPHVAAVAVAVALGLLASWLHWAGLLVGGALVGFTAPSLPRAVVGGLGFGAVALVVFALSLGDATLTVLEMTPVVYLVVASAFGLPVLGSLARGLE